MTGDDTGPGRQLHHNYTYARRYPLVLGRIGGWALPWPLTLPQLAVLLGGFVGLLATRSLWGAWLPGIVRLTVLVGLPPAAAWAVRHVRVEGRSPWRTAAGLVSLWSRPAGGLVRGGPSRGRRAVRVRHRMLVAGPRPRWSCLRTGRKAGA